MPFGGLLSLAGPAIGIGSSLAGLATGAPSSKVQLPQQYNAPYRNDASTMAYGGVDNLTQYNVAGQLLPQYQQIAQQSVNNPYAGQYLAGAEGMADNPFAPSWLQGAQMAGATGMGAGLNAYGAGGALTGNALSALPDVQALLSLGFDPQNALYSKLQQQNQDQTNAQLSMSGVGTTPYGAGVANLSNQNFNLGWQNNLLNRATQGAGAAGSLMGQIGQGVQTGQDLQAGASPQILAGAGVPYATYNQIMSNQGAPYNAFQNINANALATLGQTGQFGQQASQLPQQQIQDYMNYLQLANQTQNANAGIAQLGLQQAQQGFGQNQQMGTQLGQSVAGLAKGWGQSPWGSGTSGGFGTSSGLAPGAFMGS